MNKTLQELLGLQIIKTPDGVIIEPEKKLTHSLLSLWKDPCSKYFLLLNIDGVKMGGDAISAKYLLVNENFESQGRIELLMLLKGKEKYSTYQNNLPFLAPLINNLKTKGFSVEVEGKKRTWDIFPLLDCDMKSTLMIMGVGFVQCKHNCVWCTVPSSNLGERFAHPTRFYNRDDKSLLPFSFNEIIIDGLHLSLRVGEKVLHSFFCFIDEHLGGKALINFFWFSTKGNPTSFSILCRRNQTRKEFLKSKKT